MDSSLDFGTSTSERAVIGGERSDAMFALRFLLCHKEFRAAYMDDCDSLLQLLGKSVIWPCQIARSVVTDLNAKDGEAGTGDAKVSDVTFAPLLKNRAAWSTYKKTIARWHADQPGLVINALEDILGELKKRAASNTAGRRKVELLAKFLGLNAVETQVLAYAEDVPRDAFSAFLQAIKDLSLSQAYELLASGIDASAKAVRAALRADAPLRTYGLVRMDWRPADLEDFVRLSDAGRILLAEEFSTPEEMFRVILTPERAAGLTVDDYPHLEKEFNWLASSLKNAAAARVKGGNILFYGAPGTGKSEFARLLAEHAGLSPFAVRTADSDGDPECGQDRLSNFALSQRFLSEQALSMIIFDEIEDVFPDTGFSLAALFGGSRAKSRPDGLKAWINQQLENSPVPAIWISNSIDGIDDAFLRRFAFHVEFRAPPKSVRERIVTRCLQDITVSAPLIASLVADDSLSPAQINNAGRFAVLCASAPGEVDESALHHAVKASQVAMGRSHTAARQLATPAACDLAYLNLDSEIPLARIEQALCRQPVATLCFYGIPGSGKTSLAHRLADAVGRPLMIKRASDLLGKYVGQSEKQIAAMFREAAQEGAVLLLDEADSFLRNRRHAGQSWEVTQVNELLQQMEAFDGIFICTTNLMDEVDEAAMRRFTFKLRFDALTQAQREAMFGMMTTGDAALPVAQEIRNALQKLTSPTPGDFATVQRQEQVLGERYTPAGFLIRLQRECALKRGGQSTSIGFLA
jgi:SpoVK/Ycf46/Vps4 family AAA+-type ATPase